MHRKLRTVMLIIAMAIICVAAPSSLFLRGEASDVPPTGTHAGICHIDSSSGSGLHDMLCMDDSARHKTGGTLVSAAAGRTKHGAGRGQWLTWLCCPAMAALFLCARMRKKAVLLKPDPYLPARFLCDLFILYQKDGKKREAVLLTM